MRDGQWVIVTPRGIVMRESARSQPGDATAWYASIRGIAWDDLAAQGYACRQYRTPNAARREVPHV